MRLDQSLETNLNRLSDFRGKFDKTLIIGFLESFLFDIACQQLFNTLLQLLQKDSELKGL